MPVRDGAEPVADDEILFRRASDKSRWYVPSQSRSVSWVAFKPNPDDIKGLSVWRAKYLSPEDVAATGARAGRTYYVFKFLAGKLRAQGIEVVSSPEDGGVGHASLSSLTAGRYDENKDAVRLLAEKIAVELIEEVLGPFGPFL